MPARRSKNSSAAEPHAYRRRLPAAARSGVFGEVRRAGSTGASQGALGDHLLSKLPRGLQKIRYYETGRAKSGSLRSVRRDDEAGRRFARALPHPGRTRDRLSRQRMKRDIASQGRIHLTQPGVWSLEVRAALRNRRVCPANGSQCLSDRRGRNRRIRLFGRGLPRQAGETRVHHRAILEPFPKG